MAVLRVAPNHAVPGRIAIGLLVVSNLLVELRPNTAGSGLETNLAVISERRRDGTSRKARDRPRASAVRRLARGLVWSRTGADLRLPFDAAETPAAAVSAALRFLADRRGIVPIVYLGISVVVLVCFN